MESLDEAFARQEREAKQAELALWREIKAKDPFLAKFQIELSKAFGKLKNVRASFT